MSKNKVEKIVYFVRHGKSEGNATPIFQSPSSPLSEEGEKQAELIAKRVSKLSFETLIASPFERTKQTAEAITHATGKKAEYSDLFVETLKPTSVDGKPYTDKHASMLWREWEKSLHAPNLRVEDGENFDDLVARADKALAFLKERNEKSIVVVTHAHFLRTIIARVLLGDLLSEKAFERFQKVAKMKNTGLTVLKYQGEFEEEPTWRLWIYNDHTHLG